MDRFKNVQPMYECRDSEDMFTIERKGYKRKQHLEKPEQGKRQRRKQHLEKPELESASVPMQDHVEHQQQVTVSSQSLGCQQQHQQQQQQSVPKQAGAMVNCPEDLVKVINGANCPEDWLKVINDKVKDMAGGFEEFKDSSCYALAKKNLINLQPQCPVCKKCNTKFRYINNEFNGSAKTMQPRYICIDCQRSFTMGGRTYETRHKEKPERGKRHRSKQHLEKSEPESADVSIYKMQDHGEHQQRFTVSSQSLGCQEQYQQQQQQSRPKDLLCDSTFQQQQQLSATSDQGAEFQHQYVQKQGQHVQAHTHHSDQAAGVQNQLQHHPQPQPQLQQPSCDEEIQILRLPARSDAAPEDLFQQQHTHKQLSIHENDPETMQPFIEEMDPETMRYLENLPLRSYSNEGAAEVHLQMQDPSQSVQTHNHKSVEDTQPQTQKQVSQRSDPAATAAGDQAQKHCVQDPPKTVPPHNHQCASLNLGLSIPEDLLCDSTFQQQQLSARSDQGAEFQLQHQYVQKHAHTHQSDQLHHYPQPQPHLQQPSCDQEIQNRQLPARSDAAPEDLFQQHHTHKQLSIQTIIQTIRRQQNRQKTVPPHNHQCASLNLGLQIPEHQQELHPGSCQHAGVELEQQSQGGSNNGAQQVLSPSDSAVQLERQPPQPMQRPNHESYQDAALQLQLQSQDQLTGLQLQQQNIQKEPRNHGFHQDVPHQLRPQAQSIQQPRCNEARQNQQDVLQLLLKHQNQLQQIFELVSQQQTQFQNQIQQIIQLESQYKDLFQHMLLQPTVFPSANQEIQVPKSANGLPPCMDAGRNVGKEMRENDECRAQGACPNADVEGLLNHSRIAFTSSSDKSVPPLCLPQASFSSSNINVDASPDHDLGNVPNLSWF